MPGCSGAEILAITQVRLLLGRREAGFLAGVTRDWAHLFPCLPHQSESSRRARWLWGASGQFWAALAAHLPEDGCQQIDTSALPVKHTSRVRGPDSWAGPNGLHARFGRDASSPSGATGQWRNRVETTFKEITDQMELARHGAHTFRGLLAPTAATIAAHTLMQVCPPVVDQGQVGHGLVRMTSCWVARVIAT